MAKQPKGEPPHTSLLPFFSARLNHPKTGLVLAAVYFLLMLYVGMKFHTVGDYNVETDFFWGYVPEAQQILRGHFVIEDFRGPAYPALLAIVGVIFKDFFHSGVLLSTLAASCVLFFTFETLKRLFRVDIALIGTLLVGVNATFVQYAYTAGTDMVFNAFVAGSAFFLFRNENRTWSDVIIFSVFAALAYLTRYNGIFVVAAAPIVFLWLNPYGQDKRERIKTTVAGLAVFFACIAPWGIYCLVEKGSFFYNRNYLNIAYEMFAKGKIPWDQYWSVEANKFSSLSQVIFADPSLFVGTVLSNLYEHLVSDIRLLLGWQVGALTVAGIFLSFKEKPTVRQIGYYAFGVCFFLVLLLVFYGERFSMYLLPLYITFAMKVLTWQRLSGVRFWGKVQLGALVGFIVLIWTLGDSYASNKLNINSGPQEIPVIAEVFKKNFGESESGKIILTRKPHIAYYLDMRMETFPYVNTWEELEAKAKELRASYLFYGLMEAGMRPQFQQLLDPGKAPPWLRPVTYTLSPPAVLYKIQLPASQ